MLVIALISLLCVSIAVHIYFLAMYLRTRGKNYQRRFIDTAAINIFVSGVCIVIAIFRPDEIKKIEITIIVWAMSGMIAALMLVLQIVVFMRVWHRAKLPENYHYNFFGKKVLHSTVAQPMEIVLFFGSIPFLVVGGAYFVARIIRLFL